MKDKFLAWSITLGIILVAILIMWLLTGLKKNILKPQPQMNQEVDLRSSQKKFAEDTEERRKQMMDDLKQRMKDQQRKDY